MKLGALEILPVWDGRMVFVEPDGFPPHDSPEFEPHSRYITPTGLYNADLGGFLVRTGDQVVLIDAGLGPNGNGGHHTPTDASEADIAAFLDLWRHMGMPEHLLETRREQLKRQSITNGSLPENLQKLGFAPEDITDVVVSHMHPDHLGWVSMDDRPFFPNATVWVHEADVAHFMGPTALDETGFRVMLGTPPTKQRMAPVHDRMEVWTHDRTVAPGITMRHLPGHTPGNAMVVVASGAERAYVLGDTFHCPLELVDVNFHIPGDLDPAQAQIGKDQLLREIEDGSIAVASSHFPDLAFGRVFLHDGERTFRWEE